MRKKQEESAQAETPKPAEAHATAEGEALARIRRAIGSALGIDAEPLTTPQVVVAIERICGRVGVTPGAASIARDS